jgi:transcriptional regulator with XRE-family HTH domain
MPETSPRLFLDMPRRKLPESDFGQRLAELRKARGLTQVELAEATGTTQRAISYYENHASYPPVPFLIALVNALDVSADEILGLERTRRSRGLELDREEQRLWKKFQKVSHLPDRDQRAVVRLINSLASVHDSP